MFYIFYLSRQLHQNSFLLVKIFPGTNSKLINKKFLLVLRKLRITSSTRNENKCLPRNKNVSTINCFWWEEHLSLRYGHVIQVSGNPKFTAVQSGTQSLLAFVQRGNGLDTRRTTFNCEPWYGCWRYASLAFRTQSLLDLMSSSACNKCNVVGGVTISKKTSCMRWVRRYQMCCAMVCGVRSLAVINIYNYYCYSD